MVSNQGVKPGHSRMTQEHKSLSDVVEVQNCFINDFDEVFFSFFFTFF